MQRPTTPRARAEPAQRTIMYFLLIGKWVHMAQQDNDDIHYDGIVLLRFNTLNETITELV